MKMFKNFFLENKKIYIFTIIHFLITFFTDKLFIDFSNFNLYNYVVCKIILLLIIFIIWKLCFNFFRLKDYKKIMKYFLLYFIPAFVLLMLIFPGIWYSDDFNFLNYAKTVDYLYYLNYLTSIFYTISLMLIPIPTGVIIIQLIIFSIIIAHIVYRLSNITKSKFIYIIYPVFFLPMTLFYNLYCNRPIIYGIFYLGFLSLIFLDYLEKKEVSLAKKWILCLYIAILALWRSEGIYLFLFGPIVLTIIYDRKKYFVSIIKYLLIVLVFGVLISLPQSIATKKNDSEYSFNRFLPSIVNPLQWMLTQNIKISEEEIKTIGTILDIDAMKEYPTLLDTPCIWKNNCILSHDGINTDKFKKTYINIILKNPYLFAKAKLLTFYNSIGLTNNTYENCSVFYSDNKVITKFLNDYHFTKPINSEARKYIVRILEGRNPITHEPSKLYSLINNLAIPIITFFILFIYGIRKKNLVFLFIPLIFAAHCGLIVLTAPASYFMYYYPVYLCGYFILSVGIIYILKNFVNNYRMISKK